MFFTFPSKLKSSLHNIADLGVTNQFIEVGQHSGLTYYAVFTKNVIGKELLSVEQLPVNEAEFKHLYMYEGSILVGSIVAARAKYMTCTYNAITYIKTVTDADFICPTESESSGVYVMTDGNGNYSAVISNPNIVSDLVIQDKEL